MMMLLRIGNLLKGMLSSIISGFERRKPDALIEHERENLRRLVGQFNIGLVSHAAAAERLRSQIKRGEEQASVLRYRVTAYLNIDKKAEAATEALSLKELTSQIEEDRKQLDEAERTFKQLAERRDATVAAARRRVEHLGRQVGSLKVKRAIADLEGLASAMVGEIETAGASLSRLETIVAEEHDKATARARVAQGMSHWHDRDEDLVHEQRASEALAEFMAARDDPRQNGSLLRAGQMTALPAPKEPTFSKKSGA